MVTFNRDMSYFGADRLVLWIYATFLVLRVTSKFYVKNIKIDANTLRKINTRKILVHYDIDMKTTLK